jgi:hypothetical protein
MIERFAQAGANVVGKSVIFTRHFLSQLRHNGSYTRSTKLSTTFFSPAFSNAMVSLLPSIFTTWP